MRQKRGRVDQIDVNQSTEQYELQLEDQWDCSRLFLQNYPHFDQVSAAREMIKKISKIFPNIKKKKKFIGMTGWNKGIYPSQEKHYYVGIMNTDTMIALNLNLSHLTFETAYVISYCLPMCFCVVDFKFYMGCVCDDPAALMRSCLFNTVYYKKMAAESEAMVKLA